MLSVECDFLITSSVLKIKPNTPKQSNLDIDKLKNEICSFMFTKHKYQYNKINQLKVGSEYLISCVHLNLSSKFVLESRLKTHHSCKSVRFKQLIRYTYSAFTIDSSTRTLRINSNERTISTVRAKKNAIKDSYDTVHNAEKMQ
jgi:hypothetical protein